MAKIKLIVVKFFCVLLRLYQICFSRFIISSCRFHPSCSAYAQQALLQRGLFWGSFLSLKRLCRCHPWADGGYDPVQLKNET
ncbi:MAG: membrane protein insertion efficiency factor YidD [Gammaproteobacteria bacterium]|nr:membrane protein insertion efficiency factor YidD [Gammaproteobacteria bacterium]